MIDVLRAAERDLPHLLDHEDLWSSALIVYERPHVERLYLPWGKYRINCHRIWPCSPEEAFTHPHPWPAAMVVHGSYEMAVGYNHGLEVPPMAARILLVAGSRYEMTDPGAWHRVVPYNSEPVISVMVSGLPWDRPMPKVPRQPALPLSPEKRRALFADLRELYPHG